jgi:hypothetical protein
MFPEPTIRIYISSISTNIETIKKTEISLWAGRQENRGSFPGGGRGFCLHHRVQTGAGVQPASYKMATG